MARGESLDTSTALVRVEQLYPFPREALASELSRFENLRDMVWAQEEDRNQGAWHFVREELERMMPEGCRLRDVCRTPTASGAHSSAKQSRLVASALSGQ